ncbi:unnamed protein product [Phytophthora fragariaefolia]|uniref:Unnamed protein product n=1 Tax=Phytophthora fragariaefolia TaxID=1490495 RepID=A0A9W6TYC3_9STRA|nr:unnamed protein product [Phytophthora fragariaefolia]
MANGSSAVPATPMNSGRIEMEGGSTTQTGSGGRLSSISERSVSFDESAGRISEAKDEEVNEYEDSEADEYVFTDDRDVSDEARVSSRRSGAPHPITKISLVNLMKWPSQSPRVMNPEVRTRSWTRKQRVKRSSKSSLATVHP